MDITISLAFILSHYTAMGEMGIWHAYPTATIITSLITLIIFAKGDWKNKKMISKETKLAEKVEDEMIEDGLMISK